jgi:hypothetical protein
MSQNIAPFDDDFTREHAAKLEAFAEAHLAWKAMLELVGMPCSDREAYRLAQKVVEREFEVTEDLESAFYEGAERAKRYLEELEAFSISCDHMRKKLDDISRKKPTAEGDTSEGTRRLSRKLVEEEGGP